MLTAVMLANGNVQEVGMLANGNGLEVGMLAEQKRTGKEKNN